MDIKFLDDNFATTAQIAPQDMAAIKAAGIQSIICCRPDNEAESGQPDFADVAGAAADQGLQAAHVPLAMPLQGRKPEDEAQQFAQALENLPQPVLGYCATGVRAATLWTLNQSGGLDNADAVAAAQQAGYDLNKVMKS